MTRAALTRPTLTRPMLTRPTLTRYCGMTGEAGNLVLVEQGALRAVGRGDLVTAVTPGYRHAHLHGC